MLKYRLLVSAGAYPRTRSIIRLLRELSKLDERAGVLLSGENVLMVARIEDAYIGSRHLPRRYPREEVEAMLRFVEGVFRPVVEGF